MNCRDCQHRLDLAVLSDGVRPDEETKAHIASCPTCGRYYEALAVFVGEVAAADNVGLTADDAERLTARIERAISAVPQVSPRPTLLSAWPWVIRPVAAAALILLVALMPASRLTSTQNADQQLQVMSMTEAEDADPLPLLTNGDIDQVSRLLDQTSAAYITDQVRPSQVEDILDNTSTEELEFMLTTLSAEI